MLRIYDDAIALIRLLVPYIAQIERRDPDLARQTRRAASSIALNIAEGSYARGRNRGALYSVALGSAKETRACLDVAMAHRFIAAIDDAIAAKLNAICGVAAMRSRSSRSCASTST